MLNSKLDKWIRKMLVKELVNKVKSELKSLFSERELENHLAILMDFYLGYSRSQIVINQQVEVGAEQLAKVLQAVEELKLHKPIDYITHENIFYGRAFYVDESVLIPRSETEELVLLVLESEKDTEISMFEIGTGSACIPITIALERRYKSIAACEVSETALAVAKRNAKVLEADVDLFLMDILTEIPKEKYDVVISNPPYVKMEELQNLDKNVIEYEPVIALAPEGEPLTFYRRMIAIAPQMLKPGGRFYWEIHEDLGKEVVELLEKDDFIEIELIQDLYERDRFVKAVYNPKP
ncbi:MAG: peptide chain release factor N(5)-glutamine methyltransferase [Bacteroidetes bacterium]|nr:MAG: peptide chain release factor N(5)-glutamine methyltransferase [Bacteroidota bacterium]MBL1145885.1 peptide chain release factor N(5)-glutamine methyltransferase [Bacteroidota bacterium]NOG58679.1 peptide chain release factor N(5)-glutamine methyltransferase [Bacteroidota bacterium]